MFKVPSTGDMVTLFMSSSVRSFFHLVSDAGNNQNYVVLPNWRMIANKPFLHFLIYGGDPPKFNFSIL